MMPQQQRKSERFVVVKGKEVIGFMSANLNLHKAKNAKNDEFYTQLTDVAKITKRNDTLQKTIALKKNEKIQGLLMQIDNKHNNFHMQYLAYWVEHVIVLQINL